MQTQSVNWIEQQSAQYWSGTFAANTAASGAMTTDWSALLEEPRSQWPLVDYGIAAAIDAISSSFSSDMELRFEKLRDQWRKERPTSVSSLIKTVLSPSYQEIIGMGKDAIPFILKELRKRSDDPEHWFWALAAISGENPIPADKRGRTKEMAAIWLRWGFDHGYIA